jgi:putative peptidoglycan lipid II flippase
MGKSIARTALLLLPLQAVFRTGEAILPLLLAAWFGRNPETDVFYLAWAFFTFAGTIVASGFQDSALIPILSEVHTRRPEELPRIAGSLLTHLLVYGSLVSVLLGAVALGWFRLRYEGPLFAVAASTTVPFVAMLVALGVRSFFVGVLNMRGRFAAHPVASGTGMTISLGFIAMFKGALGVAVIPTAFLLGELVAIGILAGITRGMLGMKLEFSLERPEPVRRFAKLVASEVTGSAITRINPVVDQLIAGFSGVVGAGTVLRYAFDVASLPTSIAQATVLPVLLSAFSRSVSSGLIHEYRRTLVRALVVVCGLLVLMSVVLFAVRGPLLRMVFLHGKMDPEGVEQMAEVLPYALVGVAPFGALLILARAHVALQNSRIMISMGLLNAGLNAGFNVLFFEFIGLRGIALSTSVMHAAVALVFWVRLGVRLREQG